MNESKAVDNLEVVKIIEEFSSFGISNRNLYLVLYLLTIRKEGFLFNVVTEKSPIHDDGLLFQNEENRLDLFYNRSRLELKNVPEEKILFLKINEIFSRIFDDSKGVEFLKYYSNSNLLEELNYFSQADNFGEVFDTFLEVIVGFQGKKMGEFILPTEIGEFLIDLGRLKNNASVFNPFAGLATFGINLTDNQTYLGHELDELIWAVSILRLNAHTRLLKSEFLNANSFGNWPTSRKFDLVIANAPFKLKLTKNQQINFSGEKQVEAFFINEGIKLLKPQGKLITIVPTSFLNNHSDKRTRQMLVEKDLLEAVITFPSGLLMQTSIPFVVLLINKNKVHKKKIAFVHGEEHVLNVNKYNKWFYGEGLLEEITDFLRSEDEKAKKPSNAFIPEGTLVPEFINQSEILNDNYYLDIKRYWLDRIKGTSLKSAITPVKTISFKNALQYFEELEEVNYTQNISFMDFSHVSSKDLKVDIKDFTLSIDSLEKKRVRSGKFVNTDVFLVSLVGENLKTTFLPIHNNIIHLSNDVFPFTLNEKLINPDWLVREFHNTKVKDQIKVLVNGVVPRLKKEDFLNIKIDIPSIKEQLEEIGEIQGLEKKVDELESDIIEQNSYLRHTVAGPLSDLDHALAAIDIILNNLSKKEFPNILATKISDNHLYTLGEHIIDSKKNVAMILDTIANKLNSSQTVEQKQLEKLNLCKHLERYAKRKNENSKSLGYSIDIEFDDDFFNSVPNKHFEFILGNKELINTLLDNLVENAVKHAFSPNKNNRIEIYIWGYDEDSSNRRISFTVANTGKGLPKDTALNELKKRGFSKSDKSGDGFGLYLVNEIVRKHKGDWFLVNDLWPEGINETRYLTNSRMNYAMPKSDLTTKFSFNFPILEE